ncbi:hypothetical protein [Spirosoma fluviale]|uniref:Uncharacterized protein n=1 Tax=Spirosoma fluviale TaxID=1597977 RepID=A0A286GI69_9BACT|nr:hypothetical protein [Spirosoma fluviale]SOD95200.1 hypothetical protein SAMN06269250_4776 [Spirosoma fluviale]
MAFNNFLTPVTLAPGATHNWWYTRGADFGFQHAAADIKTPGGPLIAFDQGKKKENNGSTTYFVSIRNIGPVPVLYNLQGGGAV